MKDPTVCIDCSPLLLRSAGVKTYLYHWVRSMQTLSPETVRTFLSPKNLDRLDHQGGPFKHPTKIAALGALNRLPSFICDGAIPRCDVFHISTQFCRAPRRVKLTTTLHDLTAWIMPEWHTPAVVAANKVFAARVLKRADAIIAVSESTRQDGIRILGLDPHKVRVIHLGIPDAYFSVQPEEVNRIAAIYRLKHPYFLSVGTIEPRKNFDGLLNAWQGMPDDFRRENQLVIVGMPGWSSDITLRRIVQSVRDTTGIRYLGYVPEEDMPGLTAGAMAFVYPSLYEGFGIPVGQALAAGCPVITSNVSSLPEITGGAAVLIDPRSELDLRRALRDVRDSARLREELRSAGIARSAGFSWKASAEMSMRFFSDIG